MVSRISSFDSFSVLLSLPTHLYKILYTTSSITTLTNTNSNCKRINARCHHAQIQNHSRSGAFSSTVDIPNFHKVQLRSGEIHHVPTDWFAASVVRELCFSQGQTTLSKRSKGTDLLKRPLFYLGRVHVGVCCLCLRREDEALILGSLLLDSYHVSH